MVESLLLDMNFQVLVMLWGYIIFIFSSTGSGSLSFFSWFLLIISYVIFWVLKIVILVFMICSQG